MTNFITLGYSSVMSCYYEQEQKAVLFMDKNYPLIQAK
jgi:hypothetical protein